MTDDCAGRAEAGAYDQIDPVTTTRPGPATPAYGADVTVARTRRPDYAAAVEEAHRAAAPAPASPECLNPPAGEVRCRDADCAFCAAYGEPPPKGADQ